MMSAAVDSRRGGHQTIVSLVPSSTETLLALGVEVAACTRFCEQPGVRTVGGTKNPDVEAVVALAPDVVVMDVEENRREDADELTRRGISVLATNVTSVDDAASAVRALADAAGVEAPDVALRPRAEPTTSCIVPIWRRPWMLLGHDTYGAAVLDHLGVRVVAPEGKYPQFDIDAGGAGLSEPPELVLVPTEPYPFKPKHHAELQEAFPAARVVGVDGQDLFWWGTRTPGALERLASITS